MQCIFNSNIFTLYITNSYFSLLQTVHYFQIPFSKFFLTSKGRIQDKQNPIPLDKVTHVGISCGDKNNGPFHLEIDYIGLEFDPTHTEVFAYEMYRQPKYIVGV